MHGTAFHLASLEPRLREPAPALDLTGLTATLVVEDCDTPFGLVFGEVDVIGDGDGWYIADVRIADAEEGDTDRNGRPAQWHSLGDYLGPDRDTERSPLRFAYREMVRKVTDDLAIEALLKTLVSLTDEEAGHALAL